LSPDLTAAQEILEKLLGKSPPISKFRAGRGECSGPPLVSTTEEHPTAEVWNGSDERIAQFLTAAMQENEIPIHLENRGTRRGFAFPRRMKSGRGKSCAKLWKPAPPG